MSTSGSCLPWFFAIGELQWLCGIFNPWRACAARVTVVVMSVCPLVVNLLLKRLFALKTSHTQSAMKVKKFVGFSLKPICFGDRALPPLDGHTYGRPFFHGKHACTLPSTNTAAMPISSLCVVGVETLVRFVGVLVAYGASVRPVNAVTYSAGNEGRHICGDLSETTAFKSYTSKHKRKSQ